MGQPHRVNRRAFIGTSAAGLGVAALAACNAATAPAATGTAAPQQTVAPAPAGAKTAEGKKVYAMVDKTWSDVGMQDATIRYNEENRDSGVQVVLEETATGWDTKVLAQIRDKSLRWSGHGYAAFFDEYRYIKAGLVQPLDDYLKASKVPWGPKQKDIYFSPRIYDALLMDGKQYFIPMKANIHLAGWRQDYIEAAGYDKLPKTWDEIGSMLEKMKKALEKDQVTPFGIQREMFRAVCTTFTTFIEDPIDDQGLLKFESPEWIAVIEMFKAWKDKGLARIDSTADSYDIWQKGKIGMSLGSHSFVRTGRQVWGSAKVKGGRPPKANASAPDRTWVHIDGGFVFPNAPNPQEATDWLLAVLGPEGSPAERWWKGTATFSGSPVYQNMVDKVLKGNADYAEVYDMMSVVSSSRIITLPVAGNYAVTEAKMWPQLDLFFKGDIKAKEAMAAVRKDVNDELAKQLKK